MKWIRIEYPPAIGVNVLIYEPDGIMAVSYYAGKKPKKEKYWYEWPNGQDEQPSGYHPTHWQPLPKKPSSK